MTKQGLNRNDLLLAAIRAQLADPDDSRTFARQDVADLLGIFDHLQHRFDRVVKISDGYQYQLKTLTGELQEALANVKTLKGFIPICASCKKVRADDGYWRQIEQYIDENSEASLSHGLCPECTTNYYQLASLPGNPRASAPKYSLEFSAEELENPTVSKYVGILGNEHFAETPLHNDLIRLLEKYVLLERRMKRITRISDKYQAEFLEIKQKLEREARIDHLTGLANRREMYRILQAEIARISRHSGTLALIMFDFDNFKNINDTYGHEAGDLTLQHGTLLVRGVLRQEDTCARWGGEEFMIVQPGNHREGVLLSAERLRQAIEANPILHSGAAIRITVSLGVALHRPGDSLAQFIARADKSLYQAKKTGKNRVGPLEDVTLGTLD